MTCHKCDKVGHFARDCWAPNVRQVQNDAGPSVQTTPAATVAGSPSSNASAQMPVAPHQSRVAKIRFSDSDHTCSDVSRHDECVFDLRNSCNVNEVDAALRVVPVLHW